MSVRNAIRVLTVLGLVGSVPGYALAQEQPGIGVVSTLIGEATVARGTTTQPLALKTRDDVFMQDRISTKERSLVHVLMGGKALLTVRELSVLTITEEGGRATVDLQSGKVGLAVVRQRMKPGEIIEIRTPHAVAAVRGTVTDAAPERDPGGVVSEVSDGQATPVGLGGATATPVSLGGGTGAAVSLGGGTGAAVSLGGGTGAAVSLGGGTGAAVSLGGGTGGLVGVPA